MHHILLLMIQKVNRVQKVVAEDHIQSTTQVVLDETNPAGFSLFNLKKKDFSRTSEMPFYEENTEKHFLDTQWHY